MIVEYIRYKIPRSQSSEFEAGYAEAASALDASEHCLGYELSHGLEEPHRYILRIEPANRCHKRSRSRFDQFVDVSFTVEITATGDRGGRRV